MASAANVDTHRVNTPIALTIAGSDSGGGAGIQADLKTFSALGAYGASVITALTAQNTRAVTAVVETPLAMIKAQLDAVFDDLPVTAVKIGMLSSTDIIHTVAEGLARTPVPVVLDPVMVAKSGDALLRDEAVHTLRQLLLPKAALITPNLPEAARLLGQAMAQDVTAMAAQGKALLALGAQAVLMKGGHGRGAKCIDLLISADGTTASGTTASGITARLEAPRNPTRNTHGSGCTLSAAIAAGLAKGATLAAAVKAAHSYVQGAIAAADTLHIGSGHGPLHHFHATWRAQ
ncbi:MAG: bifunctional hydroxymethylpyrimidine kinase/phosphomethylpyrimidine kinase [Gammaproteobacteria bacterium]|nr:bifunctional hydroxymethylpyrimidine kinase/phosphomethylpyrimidine kinase [Gammaproteobacteria bacterium]